jgi:hypothetical protein
MQRHSELGDGRHWGSPRLETHGDGFVNGDDYDFFAGAFEVGC